jgi:hypothetical protein
LFLAVPIQIVEGGASSFLIGLFVGNDMLDNDQEGMPKCYGGSLLAAVSRDALVMSRQVAVLEVARRHGPLR